MNHLDELKKMLRYCDSKRKEFEQKKNKGGFLQADKSAKALEWAIENLSLIVQQLDPNDVVKCPKCQSLKFKEVERPNFTCICGHQFHVEVLNEAPH